MDSSCLNAGCLEALAQHFRRRAGRKPVERVKVNEVIHGKPSDAVLVMDFDSASAINYERSDVPKYKAYVVPVVQYLIRQSVAIVEHLRHDNSPLENRTE